LASLQRLRSPAMGGSLLALPPLSHATCISNHPLAPPPH
jgi:hypothetical protein